MSPWLTLVAMGALIVVLGLVLARVQRGGTRSGPKGLAGFLRHFDPAEVSEDVVIAVYQQLERWDSDAPPRPEHDLRARFGLLDEEIAFAVAQVARACGRQATDARDIRTIGDWVRRVSDSPAAPGPPSS